MIYDKNKDYNYNKLFIKRYSKPPDDFRTYRMAFSGNTDMKHSR